MDKYAGLASLFDTSAGTGDPTLDALFGYAGPPEEAPVEEIPSEAPQGRRSEASRENRPVRQEAKKGKGSGEANLREAYDYLVNQKGFAPHHAAGIVGNFAQESGGNPAIVGGNVLPNDPHSVGFGQWNRERLYGGKGYTGLIPFAKQRGTSPNDLQTQLDYMVDELQGPERKAYDRLLSAKTVDEAARAFGEAYERPRKQYANYENRIAQANKYFNPEAGAPQPSSQLASSAAPEAQSPFDLVELSNGEYVEVEPGLSHDFVHKQLQQNGIDAKPMRPYTTPSGDIVSVEYDMPEDVILGHIQQGNPALLKPKQEEGAPQQEGSNYLGAAKYNAMQAISGIAQGAGTEIGELGKAIAPYSSTVGEYLQEKGPQLHTYGEQLGQDIEGTYKRPENLNWAEENITYPLAETLGGVGPYAASFMVPYVGPALGTAAIHAGSMGELEQRAETEGKEFVPSEARPYAVLDDVANMIGLGATNKLLKAFGQDAILGSREAIKAAVEKGGIDEARKVVGSRIGNIAKQFGLAEAGTIGGEVVEDVIGRAYTDQPLIGDDAFNEYWNTAKQMAPLGGVTGMGRGFAEHYNKATEVARLEEQADVEQKLAAQEEERQKIENLATIGVTPEQLQKFGARNELEGLSDEELLAAYQADLAAKEEAKAAKIAELPEELRDVPYREAKRFQQMQEEQAAEVPSEEITGVEGVEPPPVSAAIEPSVEPVAPVEPTDIAPPPTAEMGAAEVSEPPEPFVRGKAPEAENPADILGLNNRSGLRKQLQGLDVNNVEHHPKIDDILQKTSATFSAENLATLENRMKEIQNASQIESAKPFDAGRSKLPEGGEEIGRAPVSGEGIRASDQEGKGIAGEGQEKGPVIKEVRGEAPKGELRVRKEKFDTFYNEHVRDDEKVTGGIGYIDPDAFLKATTSAAEEANLIKENEVYGLPDLQQPTPIELTINEKGVITGHEGRHRMVVLRDKGYKRVPVFVKRLSSSDVPLQKRLSPQRNDGNYGRDEAFVYGLEPIHYNNRAKLEEQFVERPQIKETKGELPIEVSPDVGRLPLDVTKFQNAKNARELLNTYMQHGTDEGLKAKAKIYQTSPHAGAVETHFVSMDDAMPKAVKQAFEGNALAATSIGEDKVQIYFRKDSPEAFSEDNVLHEVTHAMTEAGLTRNPTLRNELNSLAGTIGSAIKEEHPEAAKFWNDIVKEDGSEALAYGVTSPSFREILSKYDEQGNRIPEAKPEVQAAPKPRTLWDKFKDFVGRVFGVPSKQKEQYSKDVDAAISKNPAQVLKPMTAKLDEALLQAFKETAKKGITKPTEAPTVHKVSKAPSKEEVKKAEQRLKESGLVGSVKEEPLGTKMRRVTNDIFKEGRNTSFTAEYVDIRQPIAKAVQPLPSNVGGKLRSDYQWGAYEQRGNVIQESYRKGFIAMGRDGTLEAIPDAQLAVENIFKRVGKDKADVFNRILVAYRVRSIHKKDAEIHAQANKLLNMAEQMEDYASTLKDAAKRKKFNASARNLYKAAEKKLEIINWGKGRTEFSEELAKEADKVLAANPDLAREAENVYSLLRKQVDLWEQSGLIDKATADEWRSYPNYFPLYKSSATDAKGQKIDYDEMLANPTEYIQKYITPFMGRGAKSLPKVHKQEWHQHAVFVEENLLRHIAFFASAAAEHSARKNTAYNMELLGKAKRVESGKGDFIVKFKEKGKDVFYKIEDPAAYYALQSAQPLMSPLLKRLRSVGNFARGVMIMNPLFWYRQVFREPLQASLVGRAGVITPMDTLSEMAKIAAGISKNYDRIRAKGVVGPVDVIPDVTEYVKSIHKGKGIVGKGIEGIKHIHEAADAATRAVVYERAVKQALSQGFSKEDADSIGVMKAREIINFAKQGRSSAIRTIRATTPFFGAALNSLDVMARALSPEKIGSLSKAEAMEARRNFYSTALMVATFTTAYAAVMSEDEDYLKNPDRKGNWLVPMGDGKFVKIPIPFEAGWFVKELPELAVLLGMGAINKTEAVTEGAKAFKENVLPPMPSIFAVEPLVEVAIDHDFYTGSSLEGRDAEVATRDRNSKAGELTKAIVNKMEDYGINMFDVSANQLEHLGKSYLGQVWALTRTASDAYLNQGKVTPQKTLSEYPMVKGIISEGKKDRAVDQFYQVYKDVSEIEKSFQRTKSVGNKERFDQIVNDPENRKALQASDALRDIKKQIGESRTNIAKIKEMQHLTSEEMTKRINIVEDRIKKLANRGVEVARKVGLEI